MGDWVDTGKRQADLLRRQEEYGNEVDAWLSRHFPELTDPLSGRPHLAAFSAVVRLHGRYGKGRLTRREHGEQIRAAVDWWEREYGPEPAVGEGAREGASRTNEGAVG